MIIKLGRGELLAGQPITPGWYKGKVEKAVCSTKRQANVIDGIIDISFEDPALKADERTVQHTFFSMIGSGIGFLAPYAAAIAGKTSKQIAAELEDGSFEFDFEETAGKVIQFYLDNEIYQGRVINKIKNFIPYNMEAPM